MRAAQVLVMVMATACVPRGQPRGGHQQPTQEGSQVPPPGGGSAAPTTTAALPTGTTRTQTAPSTAHQPATLAIEAIGSKRQDGVIVLPRGEVSARVRVRRGTDALDGETRWMVDFTEGRKPYRCAPTLAAGDQARLAALASGAETVVELRCESIAALNGSPRARLWPGAYRVQIHISFKPSGDGSNWQSADAGLAEVRVEGNRAHPPSSAPREAMLGGGRLKWVSSSISRRTIAQGTMAQPGVPSPVATNARFVFEIANRSAKPLVVADWELFVMSSEGAVSWDAVVVVPGNWNRVVAPHASVRVELVDGPFPPALTKTTRLRMALRVTGTAGNDVWIAGPTFDVTDTPRDLDQPPVP